MTREGALAVMIAVALVLLGLIVWGWRRRMRRDAALIAPVGEIPAAARVIASFGGLYVATTRHDEPLERLAIERLGFRSRMDLTVTDAGVALDLTGQPRIFLPVERLVAADQATVAIDRVVERDGLARIVWRIDAQRTDIPSADTETDASDTSAVTLVDSYLRPQTGSARDLVAAILPTLTPTGGDA